MSSMDPGKEPRVKRQRYRVSPSKVPSRYNSEVHGRLHRTSHCSYGWNKRLGREDSEEDSEAQQCERLNSSFRIFHSVHFHLKEFLMPCVEGVCLFLSSFKLLQRIQFLQGLWFNFISHLFDMSTLLKSYMSLAPHMSNWKENSIVRPWSSYPKKKKSLWNVA